MSRLNNRELLNATIHWTEKFLYVEMQQFFGMFIFCVDTLIKQSGKSSEKEMERVWEREREKKERAHLVQLYKKRLKFN